MSLAKKILKEAQFDDINFNNIVSDFIDSKNFDREEIYEEEFDNIYNTDEDSRDPKELKDYIKQRLEERLEDIYWEIKQSIQNNSIKIYREMTVDSNWIKNIYKSQRLGIYWSYKENSAHAHWADNSKNNTIIIYSIINEKYIDWNTTIENNLRDDSDTEKEISLFKNTSLKILGIKINNKFIEKGFENIIYKA